MSEQPKISKIKIAHPGDEFNIPEAEQKRRGTGFAKIESEERIIKTGQKLENKVELFNKVSQKRWELLANFQKEVLNIFTNSDYNLDQTRAEIETMTVPKKWKEKAFEVLDKIESGRKYFTYEENTKNYIAILKKEHVSESLEEIDNSNWQIDPMNFGILPLIIDNFNGIAMLNQVPFSMLGLWTFYRYSIIMNQNSPQFNIERSVKHELEHWFQLQFISLPNLDNQKIDEYISTIIALELGAFLTDIGYKSFEQFWKWFESEFQKRVIIKLFGYEISKNGYYYNKISSDFQNNNIPISESELIDKINPYLDKYKTEIDTKLKSGESIENVIIWLRSNRLKRYNQKQNLTNLVYQNLIQNLILKTWYYS